ncbi:MAG: hypothetical protein EOP45_13085 [Sphingobacteriaceae bacterium]|nr:MAG: hypothetical protein EOP45_13085 [Sphingobacteriaceae bacterium]
MEQGTYSTPDQRQLIVLEDGVASVRDVIKNHVEWYDWEVSDNILSLMPHSVKNIQEYCVRYVEGEFVEKTTKIRYQYDHQYLSTRVDHSHDDSIWPTLLYGTPLCVNYIGTLAQINR